MRDFTLLAFAAATALTPAVGALKPHGKRQDSVSVSGAAEGFATGVTGGGDATPVYPADIDELVSYLQSTDPQVIVLEQTYDFAGSEGETTEDGCAPWGTDEGCQLAINGASNWCGDNPVASVTYDVAAVTAIDIASDKTIIGVGTSGIISGKGLRFTNDASNIIVQNIEITNLNPQYVWGGDALAFTSCSNIWIDHVTTSLIGRQHYVFGYDPSTGITLSNNLIHGQTDWSASCDGHHYWTMELLGTGDQITLKNNYIYYTSGRSPALSGNTLLHACNNVWEENSGHALEGDDSGMGLFEGNVFTNVVVSGDSTTFTAGQVFASPEDSLDTCSSYIGRSCVANVFDNSGTIDFVDTGFMVNFSGLTVADCTDAGDIARSVPSSAGNTL